MNGRCCDYGNCTENKNLVKIGECVYCPRHAKLIRMSDKAQIQALTNKQPNGGKGWLNEVAK